MTLKKSNFGILKHVQFITENMTEPWYLNIYFSSSNKQGKGGGVGEEVAPHKRN